MEKYIITGGPCVGKTKILEGLEKAGEYTISEVAREIITEQKKKENPILPETDLAAFQKLTMQRQVQREKEISSTASRVFQDRGLADSIAYAEEGKVKIPDGLHEFIGQADYTRVFFLEKLPFYTKDEQRKEGQELAERIHDKLYEIYDRLGFDMVRVPVYHHEEKANVEARVKLILAEAQSRKNREIERKYRVGHDQVKEMLGRYTTKHASIDNEKNTLYDFANILKNVGCVFRIRQNNDEHILTLKGPNKSEKFTNKTEYNFSIPQPLSKVLDLLLPASMSYSKQRTNYRPLGDNKCTISLDYLPGLGEFVEIEAGTENQVLLWERRLGLAEHAINKSYPALVRENEGK